VSGESENITTGKKNIGKFPLTSTMVKLKDAEEIVTPVPRDMKMSKSYADLAEAFNEKKQAMSRSSLFESSPI